MAAAQRNGVGREAFAMVSAESRLLSAMAASICRVNNPSDEIPCRLCGVGRECPNSKTFMDKAAIAVDYVKIIRDPAA